MTSVIKNIYIVFIKDPQFESNTEQAWEAAWNRYRQTKRNEEALNLVKHDVEKFHSHSKDRKLFKPITYVKKQTGPLPFLADMREVYPELPITPKKDYKFPPEPSEKELEEKKIKQNDISLAPQTALEIFKNLLNRGK